MHCGTEGRGEEDRGGVAARDGEDVDTEVACDILAGAAVTGGAAGGLGSAEATTAAPDGANGSDTLKGPC